MEGEGEKKGGVGEGERGERKSANSLSKCIQGMEVS